MCARSNVGWKVSNRMNTDMAMAVLEEDKQIGINLRVRDDSP